MTKYLLLPFVALLLCCGSAFASFSSGSYYDSSNAIAAAVQIEKAGIYNLVTSIDFMGKPQDKKLFAEDNYQEMLGELRFTARGVILQKMLEAKLKSVADLAPLKLAIEAEIRTLIDKTKRKHGVKPEAEVIFTLDSLYLLVPETR